LIDKNRRCSIAILNNHVRERFEGNKLFVFNYKLDSIIQLSGDAIEAYYRLKSDPINYEGYLKANDPQLLFTLSNCSIIEPGDKKNLSFYPSMPDVRALFGPRRGRFESNIAPIGVLWEVTRTCNLHCRYCFTPPTRPGAISLGDISFTKLKQIADSLIEANVFEVTITGGEALLLGKDLFDILEYLKCNNMFVALISNGLQLNKDTIQRLKALDIVMAVSLDTYCEENQRITRGNGTFGAAVNAIKMILEEQIPLNVICTLTRYNYKDLDRYLFFLEELGVSCVAIQNLRPSDDLKVYNDLKLTYAQERELSATLPKLIKRHMMLEINTTEVDTFAHLEFDPNALEPGELILVTNCLMNGCSAGTNGAYVDSQGIVYPCTSLRMLPLGNLLESDLVTLWMTSENMRFVRSLKSQTTDAIKGCEPCQFKLKCNGGCRGEAFTLFGDWFALHDRCPLKREYNSNVNFQPPDDSKLFI
jgi:radical SAM protein with 4Fe4S-binding SPASM domain